MGRARTNLKRRPKGKRGWRKIDVESIINPPQTLSIEEEQERLSKLNDSQLWSKDVKPRKSKLTKAQQKLRAKQRFASRGFEISSIESNKQSNKQRIDYQNKQRLAAFKETNQFALDDAFTINRNKPAPTHTTTLKFSNRTKKAIQLSTHKNIASQKKHIKNHRDFNVNHPYNLSKIKHSNCNTKNASIKDLWNEKRQPKKQLKNEQSSDSEDTDSQNTTKARSKKQELPDVNAQKILYSQRKALGGYRISRRSVKNALVPSSNLMSLPNPGESINPMPSDYYRLKWRSLQLQAHQIFREKYQKKSTVKWYKSAMDIDLEADDANLKDLRTKVQEMRKMYQKELKKSQKQKRLSRKENGAEDTGTENESEIRQISDEQRLMDMRANRKNWKMRMNAKRRIMKNQKKNGGHLWGCKHRFQARPTPLMSAGKMGDNLRRTLHADVDHPLRFMYNELQRQNMVQGKRRKRFTLPKKKAFLGPRYKVQTRIGKLHHANVDNKYFVGIDDLDDV